MTQETIVAAFDSMEQATAAARDVEAAGIPASCITQHSTDAAGATGTSLAGRKEPGFWAKLFGTEDDRYEHGTATLNDHSVYDRTMTGGGAVLSIAIKDVDADADRVIDVINRYHPVDIEERAASYAGGTTSTGYTDTSTASAGGTGYATTPATGGETIQLAAEQLVVGKRVMNRGTTRIRRYVVETPVSEDVSLRRESVSVDRRPVTGTGAVGADAFTDKTIEVTELNEEAVVAKKAQIVEEVVVNKKVEDRVETVKDTVRREEVEVEKVDDTDARTATDRKTY